MPTDRVQLYDTTLRDGSQMEGISLSVADKVRITQKLDELGIEWIEGGFPGSNPRDAAFFQHLKDITLSQARVSAFGGTRRTGLTCETDPNIQSMVAAETPGVTLVGKASQYQVQRILETSDEENLAMIADTVGYFRKLGKTVFFDAEHFFDGFAGNPDYSLQCLATAARAGAEALVLCDTNGGMTTPTLLACHRGRPGARPRRPPRHPLSRRRRPRRRQLARGRRGRCLAGPGLRQRLRRALR